jgi:hypothetical protein
MRRMWLGEDRRDILGASRLPAHLRFDSLKEFVFDYPKEVEELRQAAGTPDRVIFLHEFPDKPDVVLTDSDTQGTRGKSELAIGQYTTAKDGSGQNVHQSLVPQRVWEIEPRRGMKSEPKKNTRLWRLGFGKEVKKGKK